jgi:hypothetical protein
MFIKLKLGTENAFRVFRSEDILSIEPAFPGDDYALRLAIDPENVRFLISKEQAHDLSVRICCKTIAHPSEYM